MRSRPHGWILALTDIHRGILLHRHLALAFLLLPLHLACDDSSSSSTAAIPRQETVCLDVEGPAPCCECPTFEWVEANCPDGTKYLEGVVTASGFTNGSCASLDSPNVDNALIQGPYVQVTATGVCSDYREGNHVGAKMVGCDQSTGRLRTLNVVKEDGDCYEECYDEQGAAKECSRPCQE